MRDAVIKLKNISLITIIISAVIGVLALIRPSDVVHYVSIFLGAGLIATGAFSIILFASKKTGAVSLALGIVAIIAGTIICVRYKTIIAAMLFVLGFFLTASGIIDFVTSFSAKHFSLFVWPLTLILSIATTVIGIIIMFNPFESMDFLVRLLGIGLIVYAVMDLIAFIQIRRIAAIIGKQQIDSSATEVSSNPNEVEAENVTEL